MDVTINGGYYTGADDSVLTVFDPSQGHTNNAILIGGGNIVVPGAGRSGKRR